MVCDLWYLEDWEEKADWLTELINDKGVWTAPATPGLLKSVWYTLTESPYRLFKHVWLVQTKPEQTGQADGGSLVKPFNIWTNNPYKWSKYNNL